MAEAPKAERRSHRFGQELVSMASGQGLANLAAISKSERDYTAPGSMLSRSLNELNSARIWGSLERAPLAAIGAAPARRYYRPTHISESSVFRKVLEALR